MREDIASYTGRHLKLEELKWMWIWNDYFYRTIPDHPEDVEFRVSYLRHNTNLQGFFGIWDSEGFKKPTRSHSPKHDLVWWSPDISRDDITKAEKQYLDENTLTQKRLSCSSSPLPLPFCHPLAWGTSVSACRSMSCWEVTSSSSVQARSPTFTFLRLWSISRKWCILLRFMGLVRISCSLSSPCSRIPRMQCVGSMKTPLSGVHRQWVKHKDIPTKAREDYMWDNIGVALHVPHGEIFQFSKEILAKRLKLCEGAQPKLNTEEFVKCEFDPIRL